MKKYKKYGGYKINRNDRKAWRTSTYAGWKLVTKIGGMNDCSVYKYREINGDKIMITLEGQGEFEYRIFENSEEFNEFYDKCENRGYVAYHMIMEISNNGKIYDDDTNEYREDIP